MMEDAVALVALPSTTNNNPPTNDHGTNRGKKDGQTPAVHRGNEPPILTTQDNQPCKVPQGNNLEYNQTLGGTNISQEKVPLDSSINQNVSPHGANTNSSNPKNPPSSHRGPSSLPDTSDKCLDTIFEFQYSKIKACNGSETPATVGFSDMLKSRCSNGSSNVCAGLGTSPVCMSPGNVLCGTAVDRCIGYFLAWICMHVACIKLISFTFIRMHTHVCVAYCVWIARRRSRKMSNGCSRFEPFENRVLCVAQTCLDGISASPREFLAPTQTQTALCVHVMVLLREYVYVCDGVYVRLYVCMW
jgi:hypothetical protein